MNNESKHTAPKPRYKVQLFVKLCVLPPPVLGCLGIVTAW